MLQKSPQNLLSRELSYKTIPCGYQINNLKTELKKYFVQTFQFYQKLFSIIKEEKSFFTKPQPLRHPLIFYLGHTAAFFINKFIDRGLITERINQAYERMFAVGVDEMDWDDLNESHYDWPTVPNVKQYRKKVKQLVLDVIEKSNESQINWNSDLWIIMMGIQHQRIHLETSAVIIRRLPVNEVTQPEWMKQCPHVQKQFTKVPLNFLEKVPALHKEWDRQRQTAKTYGWDNEFGHKQINTKQYYASKMLVSNAEFLQFILDDGYNKSQYWTEEGRNWLKSTQTSKPLFWKVNYVNAEKPEYRLRTISNIIQMPWDWPAEVNNLEAHAFCNWKSQKQGKKLRLPTQDEYFAMRQILKTDLNDWKQRSVGNINLQYWLSPNPVNMFQTQGFYDIVGNVWQHTVTPIYPFEGFEIHPNYDDFTTPTFDNRHNLIKGGSFISTGNQALYHSRYAFRRHFYQFAGFRYVESNNPIQVQSYEIDQSDQSVEKALKTHFVESNSYVEKVLDFVEKRLSKENIKRSAVIGCSVGRLPLEFAKKFQSSYGTDYTARYFQMATRLLQQKFIKYRSVQIELQKLSLNSTILQKVHLYQMSPENVDIKKINQIEFMIIDGFSVRQNTISKVIRNSLRILSKSKGKLHLLLIIDNKNNFVENVEVNELISQEYSNFKINLEDEMDLTSLEGKEKIGKMQYIRLEN